MADSRVEGEAGDDSECGKIHCLQSQVNTSDKGLLLKRHKIERKELQSKIQNLKHGIAKGDRKKKKEINEQIAMLEIEMDKRHEEELANVIISNGHLDSNMINGIDAISIDETSKANKISKAQKRRDKKADKQRERDHRIAEQEIENEQGVRNLEFQTLKMMLAQRNFQIHEIPSDGNCLYMAVQHQLQQQNIDISLSALRRMTANRMREYSADFRPFLTDPNTLNLFNDDQYEKYCNEIENTSAWGGHLELQALSCALEHPIEITQADGPPISLGEQFLKEPLILAYHRHAYNLGAHYNSVTPFDSNDLNVEDSQW